MYLCALSRAVHISYVGVVMQFDRVWTRLTCREHLTFAFACYQPALKGDLAVSSVKLLLQGTGLTSCADVVAGSELIEEFASSGLSGGQRRRLSLAVALAKKPAVLIADEPTSGLDATAAAAIMKLLGELARDSRVAVMCTIHQPSALMYERLDKLLLLTKGRTAYYGPASGLLTYLDSVGKPLPQGASLAEHALNLVNADFENEAAVDAMVEEWSIRSTTEATTLNCFNFCVPPSSPQTTVFKKAGGSWALPAAIERASYLRQLALLFERHMLTLFFRDVLCVALLATLTVSDTVLLSLFFWDALRTHDQRMVPHVYYFVLFSMSLPGLYTMLYAYYIGLERMRVRRELFNGMYHPSAYVLTSTVTQLCSAFLIPIMSLVFLFLLTDFEWSAFPEVYAISAVSLTTFIAMASLVGWGLGSLVGACTNICLWGIAYGQAPPSPIHTYYSSLPPTPTIAPYIHPPPRLSDTYTHPSHILLLPHLTPRARILRACAARSHCRLVQRPRRHPVALPPPIVPLPGVLHPPDGRGRDLQLAQLRRHGTLQHQRCRRRHPNLSARLHVPP